MDNRYIIALELSGSQVKGAAATINSSPAYSQFAIPVVEAIACEDKVNCVQYGRVQNLIEAAKDVNYVVKKLENDPKFKGGKVIAAYVGISGRSLGSVQTTAELYLPSEMEITANIVKQLEQEAAKVFDADRKPLRIVPRKFYVDNQVNPNPVGALGSKLKGEYTVVTCNKANLRNLEMLFGDRLQLTVREYVVTPLALADLLLSQEERQLGCMLVDMGAQTTTISIYKDRALQYLATLPLGSQNITRDIAMGLNIIEERAEMAKCHQGNAMADSMESASDENAKINCYVQARIGEINANIYAQIGYAGFKPTDLAGGIIITGRGSKLRNFDMALENKTKMKVRRASIPNTITVQDRGIDSADFASLLAIVLQASKTTDVGGCVKAPEPTDISLEEKPAFGAGPSPVHEEDNNDDGWDNDDEENAQIDERRERAMRRKAEKEAAKRAKEEQKRREREEREQARLQRPRSSALDWLKAKIYQVTASNDDEDANLDDN